MQSIRSKEKPKPLTFGIFTQPGSLDGQLTPETESISKKCLKNDRSTCSPPPKFGC